MDNQEAKFILRAYRANGADAADPAFSEALEQARRDPTLSRWLEKEQALDAVIARKLGVVVPPANLRESILAGGRVSRRPARSWYNSPVILGLAACVLLVLGLSFTWPKFHAASERQKLAELVIDDTLHGKHGSSGAETSRLRSFLENTSNHLASGPVPAPLPALENTGCRTLSLAGHELAELCFLREGKEYHLYITSRIGGASAAPKFFENNGASAVAWNDAKNSYVLASTAGVSALKQLL